jgi:hypothetical protein
MVELLADVAQITSLCLRPTAISGAHPKTRDPSSPGATRNLATSGHCGGLVTASGRRPGSFVWYRQQMANPGRRRNTPAVRLRQRAVSGKPWVGVSRQMRRSTSWGCRSQRSPPPRSQGVVRAVWPSDVQIEKMPCSGGAWQSRRPCLFWRWMTLSLAPPTVQPAKGACHDPASAAPRTPAGPDCA